MSDLKLNANDDIEVGDTDLLLITGREAIAQHMRQRLKLFFGELVDDKRRGIPYIEQVFVKAPDPVNVDAALKHAIVTTPGFLELTVFDIDIGDDRLMTLTFQARTTEGVVDFREVIP